MSLVRYLSVGLILAFLSVPLGAADTDKTVKQMESLTQLALEQAVKAISTQGLVYPFALLQSGEGKVSVISYQGEVDKRPPDDEYASALIRLLRQETAANPAQRNAVVVRMSEVKTDAGESFPGVWVLTDHRDAEQAKVLFQTFVKSSDGKSRELGDVLVEPSNLSLFAKSKPAQKKQ